MDTKKMDTMTICHLVVMGLLALTCGVAAFTYFQDASGMSGSDQLYVYMVGCVQITFVAAMIFGIIYVMRGYSKAAATQYKLLLCMLLLGAILVAVGNAVAFGFEPIVALMIVKALLLFVLAFWKDLGKSDTWIVFGVNVCIDLICLVAFNRSPHTAFVISSALTLAFADFTIALAIRGKYEDKEARGTK